jgi:hypothetical protein
MPKQHSTSEQRKRLKVETKRQRISVFELKQRLQSDGDGDNPAIPPEDNIIVSHDTYEDSLECPNPASNTSNASTTITIYTTLCPVEENLATVGTVTTVLEHKDGESIVQGRRTRGSGRGSGCMHGASHPCARCCNVERSQRGATWSARGRGCSSCKNSHSHARGSARGGGCMSGQRGVSG